MISKLLNYFKTYDGLKDKPITIDFTPPQINTFSLKSEHCESVYMEYVDGRKVMQGVVTLCARAPFSFEPGANEEMINFFQEFAGWLFDKDDAKDFPDDDEHVFLKLTPIGAITVDSNDGSTGEYTMPIKYIYTKKGKKYAI